MLRKVSINERFSYVVFMLPQRWAPALIFDDLSFFDEGEKEIFDQFCQQDLKNWIGVSSISHEIEPAFQDSHDAIKYGAAPSICLGYNFLIENENALSKH